MNNLESYLERLKKLDDTNNGMIYLHEAHKAIPLLIKIIEQQAEVLRYWSNETEWWNVPPDHQVARARNCIRAIDKMIAEAGCQL